MTESHIVVTLVRHHWLPLKRRSISGSVTWLSTDGMTVVSPGQLPVGARVNLTISAAEHELKNIPAQIVRAEPGAQGSRYSLRFHKQQLLQHDGDITLRLLGYLASQNGHSG